MEWDESLEIGMPTIIAKQHQSLFQQVSDLLDHSNVDRMQETLELFGKFVLMHFGTEEKMQKESNYPKADDHKKMHDAFVAALGELKAEYESSDNKMLIFMKTAKAVLDWVESHVKVADKDFGSYTACGVKL